MITLTTRRFGLLVAILALVASACSSASGSDVATLSTEEPTTDALAGTSAADEVDDEDAILAFSACMRENGIEDFEDPSFDGEGGASFTLRGQGNGAFDQELMRSAMEACREHLEGLSLGGERVDRSEIEDQLYEFAACMRDNGFDMPDPDFGAGPGLGGGAFLEFDPDDPEFTAAMEACEDVFGGSFRFGGRGTTSRATPGG